MASTSSSDSDTDDWVPTAARKQGKRPQIIDDSYEIVGATSEEDNDESFATAGSASEGSAIVGSFENTKEIGSRLSNRGDETTVVADSHNEACEDSDTTNKIFGTTLSPNRQNDVIFSSDSSDDTEEIKDDSEEIKDDSEEIKDDSEEIKDDSEEIKDDSEEINDDSEIEDYGTRRPNTLPIRKEGSSQSDSESDSATRSYKAKPSFKTSTPKVFSGGRKMNYRFEEPNLTCIEEAESLNSKTHRMKSTPLESSNDEFFTAITGDASAPKINTGERLDERKSPPKTDYKNAEDIIVAGIHEITLAGSKKFSFKHKSSNQRVSNEKQVGATCLNYFDEEEEDDEDQSISANFDFNEDSGHGDSDIQVVHEEPVRKDSRERINVDDDLQILTEKLKQLPLGKNVKAPSRTVFLEELPSASKKEQRREAYDPLNPKHQEFYGDVQRTVEKFAEIIESMPTPSDDFSTFNVPQGLVSLYDHQLYGLKWLSWRENEFPGGGILGDEMGLGKTVMIIALIMKSKQEGLGERNENWISTEETKRLVPSRTTLVVCPVGCILQWSEEISSKGKGLRVNLYHGAHRTSSAAMLAQSDVVLTTYHTLIAEIPKPDESYTKKPSPLSKLYWHRIVLDEAHTIRNPKTHGAQSIYQLHSRHRWAVTGTPVHNKPEDLFSMAKFLKLAPFDDPKVWDFWIGLKAVRKTQDSRDRLYTIGKALILRRTKTEVETAGGNVRAIPPKTVMVVNVELSEQEKRLNDYLMIFGKRMLNNFLAHKEQRMREMQGAAMTYTASRRKKEPKADAPEDVKFSHLFAILVRLRQCTVLPHLIETMLEEEDVDENDSFDEFKDEHIISKRNPIFDRLYESSKIKKILEDLDELKLQAKRENRPMDKVVIVSSWTSVLNILYEHLRNKGLSAVFITGREKTDERMDAMKKFNQYPNKPQIVLLSLAAGGVGLNLIGGNHVFFVEPHWNPQMELQAQDRVHRFGQTKEVFIRRYIVEDSVEQRVMELQEMKVELADGVLNNTKKTSSAGLSMQQMRRLFDL